MRNCNPSMARQDVNLHMLHFRRWSRKKTGILASLSRSIKICTLCLVYGLVIGIYDAGAQEDTTSIYATAREIEEIEVTGQGSPAAFSGMSRAAASVIAADLDRAGIQNLADVLEYAANIDIRQRGNNGIQADPAIRGGSFDQVLILLNGIVLNDPQTGHVSLDLPVDMDWVERIDVLQGPAARMYGPFASTGAINIITRKPDRNEVSASYATGSYAYGKAQAAVGYVVGTGNGMFSFSHTRSDGYARNTDFNLQNAFFRHGVDLDDLTLDLQAGYQHKRFGANGFYTPRFPDQAEEADVFLVSLKAENRGKVRIIPAVYWRRRRDHFILMRDNPGFYQNFHRTNVAGSSLKWTVSAGNLSLAGAMDLRSEYIISNSIGHKADVPVKIRGEDSMYYDRQYGRTSYSYSQEISYRNAGFDLTGGLMVYRNSAYPGRTEVYPGLDLSYSVYCNTRFYASYNMAGSLPTFTDLFYTDPDNQGNQDLYPSGIRSLEAGIRYAASHSSGSLGFFRYAGQDVISWQWSVANSRFAPVNLGKYDVSGIEAVFHVDLSGSPGGSGMLQSLSMAYMWLNSNKSMADSVSKYDHLRHKLSLVFNHALFRNTGLVWRFSYQDRNGGYVVYDPVNQAYEIHDYAPFFLADVQIEWKRNGFSAFAEVSNLFDTSYIDAGSLHQPGRWLKTGIRLALGQGKP